MTLIFVLLGALLARAAAVRFYENYWNRGLEASVAFQEKPLREGEEGGLTEVIENRKNLPLPLLLVGFGVSRSLEFAKEENASVSDKSYKRDVFSVMGNQRLIRQVPFTAKKRGYYEITRVELTARGLLLSEDFYDARACCTCLYVYPKRLGAIEQELLLQKLAGTWETRKRLLEDPFQFRGIREYAPGDPVNRINWKASARTGSLLVNLNHSAVSGGVWLLLDLEDETIWKYEELHEECIRLAGAMGEFFLSRGLELGLLSNGRDVLQGEEFRLPKGGGRSQREKLLRGLARLDFSKTARRFSDCLMENRERLSSQGDFCILLTRNQETCLQESMAFLAEKNQGALYMAVLHSDMEFKLRSRGRLQLLRWEVKR